MGRPRKDGTPSAPNGTGRKRSHKKRVTVVDGAESVRRPRGRPRKNAAEVVSVTTRPALWPRVVLGVLIGFIVLSLFMRPRMRVRVHDASNGEGDFSGDDDATLSPVQKFVVALARQMGTDFKNVRADLAETNKRVDRLAERMKLDDASEGA